MQKDELWHLCFQFKNHVCQTLNLLPSESRETLKGDYVFFVCGIPKFIVVVNGTNSWSLFIQDPLDLNSIEYDAHASLRLSPEEIQNIIDVNARTKIKTDDITLRKLLLGTLKAKIAFLTGRVQILGDFPAFFKLVSQLKKNGVKPINTALDPVSLN